jgi:hypothetical protein
MFLATPKSRAILWLVANVPWIAIAPAAALYFYRQLQRGAYPMEADSIGLPIVGIAMWGLVLLLPLNFIWWLLLRRYPGSVPLSSSNKVTAANAKVIGAVGVICAIVWGVAGVLAVLENVWEITPVFFFWSYITLAMRAAYITAQRKPDCPLP